MAALCAQVAKERGVPEPLWLGRPAPVSFPPTGGRPDVVAQCFEAGIQPGDRKRTGSHFTPQATAAGLWTAALACHGRVPTGAICDPTVGGGAFLLAALRSLTADERNDGVIVEQLWGADIDPIAVAVSRSVVELEVGRRVARLDERIAVGDSLLGTPWDSPPMFEVLIGNPPFLSQMRGSGVRTAVANEQISDLLGFVLPPYAESAMLFVVHGFDLCDVGATVALILPQSVLSARDNGVLRDAATEKAAMIGMWFSAAPVFSAGVRVCAPIFRAGETGFAPRIARWIGPEVSPEESYVSRQGGASQWVDPVLDLLGIPLVTLKSGARLGDLASATAGFRDEFYGIAGIAEEFETNPDGLPIITSGLIDPQRSFWGERSAKLAGRTYSAPVVPPQAMDLLEPRVRRWVEARLVPKLLVATQTRVIEVLTDPTGVLVPITPVVSVETDLANIELLAAVLSSPPVCAWAARRTVGSAMAVDAVKLSAKQLLEVPVPDWSPARDEAVELFANLRGGRDRQAWEEFGLRMCRVFAVDAPDLVLWWLDRMRWDEGGGQT